MLVPNDRINNAKLEEPRRGYSSSLSESVDNLLKPSPHRRLDQIFRASDLLMSFAIICQDDS